MCFMGFSGVIMEFKWDLLGFTFFFRAVMGLNGGDDGDNGDVGPPEQRDRMNLPRYRTAMGSKLEHEPWK